jgi:MYXO-CTERM domain-containing protein
MKHCNMLRAERGTGSIRIGMAVAAALLLSAASAAHAGELVPQLSLVGGTGVPGSTVSVVVALSGDPENLATSADVDFAYPDDLVTFTPPVTENCSIAERLADTHEIAGTLVEPGFLRLSIIVQGTPVEFPPLGDGDLGSCDFFIQPGAPVGTAALEIDEALLFDGLEELNVEPVDGAIIITEPVATPTSTAIPATATNTVGVPTPTNTVGIATPTNTMGGTGGTPTNTVGVPTATSTVGEATATHTVGVATATHTVGTPPATATRTTGTPVNTPTRTSSVQPTQQAEDDGCNIAASDQSSSTGTLMLLLAPALLIWARRRRF